MAQQTAKEKAEELVDKFTYEISGLDKYEYYLDSNIRFVIKQCALIAVDEILETNPYKARNYWQEVKKEIEKL